MNRRGDRAPDGGADLARQILAARGADVVEARRRVSRRGSDASIHDLRVATRRLQAALEVFGPRLPERPLRRLDRRARRIRRQLGQARNARVLRTLLRRLRVPQDGDESRLVTALVRRLDRPARQGRRDLRLLPGIRKRIHTLLQALSERPERSVAPAGRPGGRATPTAAALPDRVEAVARAARLAGDGDPESMHRLRIAIKRYRYVLEVLSEAGAPALQPSIHRARALQRELGRLHDLDILIEWVRGAARVPAASAFPRRLVRLRGRQAAKVQRRLARFRPAGVSGARRTAA
ncbi:MAG TPA: CHAD domain-containing protein [Candidatus Polarisedimenticolia bacterium]|nr:CHAD domain-containing protein [Candidatus Polarisedimenticolia bacterium]